MKLLEPELFQEPEEKEQPKEVQPNIRPGLNPRLVFSDPDSFFGKALFYDLLMEQQEQF